MRLHSRIERKESSVARDQRASSTFLHSGWGTVLLCAWRLCSKLLRAHASLHQALSVRLLSLQGSRGTWAGAGASNWTRQPEGGCTRCGTCRWTRQPGWWHAGERWCRESGPAEKKKWSVLSFELLQDFAFLSLVSPKGSKAKATFHF